MTWPTQLCQGCGRPAQPGESFDAFRPANQELTEGPEPTPLLFDLRAEGVGEEISVPGKEGVEIAELVLKSSAGGVAHELALDPEPRLDVVHGCAASAVEEEGIEVGDVGASTEKRKSGRQLDFRIPFAIGLRTLA